ncbi:MAG: VOC family protein [Myxococcota bacterium]
MIQRLSHVTIPVLDQERALAFYRDQLGFAVRTDQTMGAFRWLTLGPKGQPDLELVLMPVGGMPVDDPHKAAMQELVEAGAFGVGVFETADVRRTYEELSAKGVTFRGPPEERPYGVECIVRDSEGNWFSLTQRR